MISDIQNILGLSEALVTEIHAKFEGGGNMIPLISN